MARKRRNSPPPSHATHVTGKCLKCDYYGRIRTKIVKDDIEFVCSNCGHHWKP